MPAGGGPLGPGYYAGGGPRGIGCCAPAGIAGLLPAG